MLNAEALGFDFHFPVVAEESVGRRVKHGFSVPIDEWFRGPLKSFVKDTLLASDARAAEWLEPATVASICDGHFTGTRSNGTAIWILLNFELWARHYLH